MRLIDTHCHLVHPRLRGQAQDVLGRAAQAGMVALVCASGNLEESRQSRALTARADLAASGVLLRFTAGVHPHEAKTLADDPAADLAALAQLCADERCAALGEIGLDYHYDFSPRDRQRTAFAAQLELARRLRKTVVVHTREALDDTVSILRDSGIEGAGVVFHSFTGGPTAARAALDLGAAVSFSGIVTFKNAADTRAAAALVPDDRLLIETDAPYLSPEPVRKMKTNEPANVAHVCAAIAHLRGTSPERLAELTTANAARIFGLPPEA